MEDQKYNWFKLNLNVACLRCGTKIPMQSPLGAPVCSECGETCSYSWEEVVNVADINFIRKNETSNKKVMGEVDVSLNNPSIANISCNHCKEDIDLQTDPIESNACNCPSCKEKLVFEKIKSYPDYLFYRYVKQKPNAENSSSTIAVRCAACGAPLQADPGKVNYNCSFCGVENILPVTLRQKRVLDDLFVGVTKKTILPNQILASENLQEITNCLKTNKANAFVQGDLDKLMQRRPDNLEIYKLITNYIGYALSKETFEKMWLHAYTKEAIIIAGENLKKSQAEITHQHMSFDETYMANYRAEQAKKEAETFWDKLKNMFS